MHSPDVPLFTSSVSSRLASLMPDNGKHSDGGLIPSFKIVNELFAPSVSLFYGESGEASPVYGRFPSEDSVSS